MNMEVHSMDKQERFLEHYLNPTSPTFGKTAASGRKAGYSESTARNLASPAYYRKNLKKVASTLDMTKIQMAEKLTPETIIAKFEDTASFIEGLIEDPAKLKKYGRFARLRDLIKIYDLLLKLFGMYNPEREMANQFRLILNCPPKQCPHCGKMVEAEAEESGAEVSS